MGVDYARDVVTASSEEVRRAWAVEKAIQFLSLDGVSGKITDHAEIIEEYVKNGKKEQEDEDR